MGMPAPSCAAVVMQAKHQVPGVSGARPRCWLMQQSAQQHCFGALSWPHAVSQKFVQAAAAAVKVAEAEVEAVPEAVSTTTEAADLTEKDWNLHWAAAVALAAPKQVKQAAVLATLGRRRCRPAPV